jgi:galactokinase
MRDTIEAIYGHEIPVAGQTQRYNEALAAFVDLFGPGPVSLFRAPGRVNLVGEHTDYSQGYVLPAAIDRDVLILARSRDDAEVRVVNVENEYPPREFAISSDIPPHPAGDWANYIKGPAQLLAREVHDSVRGMDALVCGRSPWGVPRGAGLASSSALTVAASLALMRLNSIPLSYGVSLAAFCSQAEWYVGTRGGIMDQFTAILSQRDHALFIDCRPRASGYRYSHAPLPEGHVLVLIDSGERHSNTGPLYNLRVVETRLGVRLLQSRYPWVNYLRDLEEIPWDHYCHLLPEEISAHELAAKGIALDELVQGGTVPEAQTFAVRQRCRHVITENARVLAFVEAMQEANLEKMGQLMVEAHASARDDYEISTPLLDKITDTANEHPDVVGARLTGAGWGGCVVALALAEAVDDLVERVLSLGQEPDGQAVQAFVTSPGPGAGHLATINI